MADEEPTTPVPVQSLGRHHCGGTVLFEGTSRKTFCADCGEEGARVVKLPTEDPLAFEIVEGD